MKQTRVIMIAMGLMLAGGAAWSQEAQAPVAAPVRPARVPQTNSYSLAGGDGGPVRFVWAAHKSPETPYVGPNRPIWHIADILKSHKGQTRWEQKVLLNRDFDGRYVQLAPGDKTKCQFYADDRAYGWVYSGQLKVTIDGQEPKVLTKGWAFNVAPRLSYCLENVGSEPVVFYRTTPANQVPSYAQDVTPTPVKGYVYSLAKITATGGYDTFNKPFFNVDEYGASTRSGEKVAWDGHTSASLNVGPPLTALPPDTSWGHFHENMQEVWLDVYGSVCALISGEGVVHAVYGDLINADEERWHRATSCPNTGRSVRLAMTPRAKEGQVHYFQTDQPPGN